jgi:hypothetical protein
LIELRVGISDGWRQQLWKKSRSEPPAVFATFLVDTGSDSSMVDEQIMRTLGLSAVNQREVLTSESQGQAKICNVYDIGLEIPNGGSAPWKISSVEANGRPLMSESVQGVLGRDVLSQVVLIYNGPLLTYSIDYPY